MKRNLYLNIQEKEEARQKFLEKFQDGSAWKERREVIPVSEALGRLTWEAVYANYSSPSYNSCAMDGIAVISAHTKKASEDHPVFLKPETDYIEVDTGDLLPPPYDAVIMAEDLIETEHGYKIIAPTHPFAHVRAVGEDVVAKEMVLPSHHKVRPIDVAVLLSAGVRQLPVFRKPVTAILPTGDEMIDCMESKENEIGQARLKAPEDGKILETNSFLFQNMAAECGGIGVRYPILKDDLEVIKEAVLQAVKKSDLVIINAGSSAGRDDYTIHAIRELGTVYTHGVSMKPGKPVILGAVRGKPVIGLPGYPVSAYLAFQEFAAPLLDLYYEKIGSRQPCIKARLTKTLMSGLKYEEYVRVKLGIVGEQMIAVPLERGAGASMSLVKADGFCIIPKNQEGIAAHETVEVRLLKDLRQIEKTLVIIGSHDLILDVLNDVLKERQADVFLSSTHVGSLAGLMALRKKEAHLAPSHLLEEADGTYNISIVKELFPGEKMVIIKGVRRRQGFIVQKKNPKDIHTIHDLTKDGVRYINRQKGAGTRVLLDYQLKQAKIRPQEIDGYSHEVTTHMSVAAAVQKGNADVGMGVYSSAKALDLDFVDVAFEEYDFVTYQSFLEMPYIQAFLAALKSEAFLRKLDEMGGYSYEQIGEIIKIESM